MKFHRDFTCWKTLYSIIPWGFTTNSNFSDWLEQPVVSSIWIFCQFSTEKKNCRKNSEFHLKIFVFEPTFYDKVCSTQWVLQVDMICGKVMEISLKFHWSISNFVLIYSIFYFKLIGITFNSGKYTWNFLEFFFITELVQKNQKKWLSLFWRSREQWKWCQ